MRQRTPKNNIINKFIYIYRNEEVNLEVEDVFANIQHYIQELEKKGVGLRMKRKNLNSILALAFGYREKIKKSFDFDNALRITK